MVHERNRHQRRRRWVHVDQRVTPLERTDKRVSMLERQPRMTLGELTYAKLREAILTTQIEPGTLISENELSAIIGVSRTPIREAIRRLAEDRVVDVTPSAPSTHNSCARSSRNIRGGFDRRLYGAGLRGEPQRVEHRCDFIVIAIVMRRKPDGIISHTTFYASSIQAFEQGIRGRIGIFEQNDA